ncbi:Adenylate kinase 2 [Tieghemiomyces parasiticus]|uniref:GTP:AMP phosphotransferase, mitochondrial n=1 Tax=Tieghemiomyces parasiticus TaxID=78921 RepID=A0A9W8DXD0_9FUNG|nr:Adenylate kinase 2 [Tieghemiomyces parasiticus]
MLFARSFAHLRATLPARLGQPTTASTVTPLARAYTIRAEHANRDTPAPTPGDKSGGSAVVNPPAGSSSATVASGKRNGDDSGDSCLRMLLVGAPGAGKGTQSARIRAEFPVYPISSGDVLRRHIALNTIIGRRAAPIVASGEMVPDNIMVDLIDTELDQLDHEHWLLDGFPRNAMQAQLLDASLAAKDQPINTVINLVVPEDVILQRIEDRWVHVPSGRVYNLSYNPPKTPGIDDLTGEPLTRRADDTAGIVKARLAKYHELTIPLLEHYDKLGLLVSFKGSTSDEIYPQIRDYLAPKFARK